MRQKSIILSHPTANANVRAALKGLNEEGVLGAFHTTVAFFPENFMYKLARGPLKDLRRRTFGINLKSITHTHPFREMGRMIAMKAKFQSLIKHETGYFSVDAIYHDLDCKVSRFIKSDKEREFDVMYAYEDGAYDSFLAAGENKLIKIYDLPIGYWRAARFLLEKERELRPEWAMTMDGFSDSMQKLERKDEEIQMADKIFVASSFTKKSLQFYPGMLNDIEVVPYGFPPVAAVKEYNIQKGRKLKLLYVGGLSQRKGIANVFEAVEQLGEAVELTVVGKKGAFECAALDKALQKCNWIPGLPHQEILNLMRSSDVLLFPSLFEGFGLVITEAMSQGTPVITTDRTAGPDFIENEVNGCIIEAGSTPALVEAINQLIEHPENIEKMGLAARETARLRPWDEYGKMLSNSIVKYCDNRMQK
jgi:glycosyltransferase involved in cell wall biosynthesis